MIFGLIYFWKLLLVNPGNLPSVSRKDDTCQHFHLKVSLKKEISFNREVGKFFYCLENSVIKLGIEN